MAKLIIDFTILRTRLKTNVIIKRLCGPFGEQKVLFQLSGFEKRTVHPVEL
jgi:hypothetical protein